MFYYQKNESKERKQTVFFRNVNFTKDKRKAIGNVPE